MDYTGTGNSLNVRHPHTLQLIMDSLRYWVTEMHVDGFRFDLASTLAREFYDVDRLSTFFDLVQQDPVISQVKLIAEPWDVGPGGYQVGNFPPGWTEWNGKYRDTVRDFWRGTPGTMGEFAARLTGSSDLYQDDGRRPYASINFVTAHDGFTLNDLVSYNEKHNEANGEGGQDGADDNNSWNHGVEGPTDDEAIRELRQRQRRNFLATLFLSQGVPMVLHGDEIGRTQYGNNNGYCQDSEISWMEWSPEKSDSELMDFTGRVSELRASHPVFRRRRFFNGRTIRPVARRHRGPARHRLVHLVGRGDDRPGLGVRRGGRAHGLPQRRRHPRERRPRPARRRRLVHADLQRPLRGRRRHAPRQGLPAPLGRRARHHHRRGRRRHRPHDPDQGGPEPARGPPRARRGRRPHGHGAFDAAAAAHRPDGAVVSIPASTYRLQLSPAQDFAAARGLVDYLESLGVGALYCSPILQAAPGSTHGYDVVDPTRANDQLGGESGRRDLVATLRAAGLGVLVDLVPNHMGVAVPEANPSWWSLLRDGPDSEYASWYDADLSQPLLIPVLGSPDDVSALELVDGELRYYEHRYPVAPGTGEGTPQEVHERQHYRLVHWRRGNAELTYRRFFDVSDLAAVRVDDPAVFDATHAEVLRWRAAGQLDGLRIDHPDGLSAPGAYLRRLRGCAPALGDEAWLLVEKILGPDETLPLSWPADGTTGYEALREIGGLFVDPRGRGARRRRHRRAHGRPRGPLAHRARGAAPGHRRDPRRRGAAHRGPGARGRRPREGARRRRGAPLLVPGLPLLPARGPVVAGPRGRHRGHGTPGARRASSARSTPACSPSPTAR